MPYHGANVRCHGRPGAMDRCHIWAPCGRVPLLNTIDGCHLVGIAGCHVVGCHCWMQYTRNTQPKHTPVTSPPILAPKSKSHTNTHQPQHQKFKPPFHNHHQNTQADTCPTNKNIPNTPPQHPKRLGSVSFIHYNRFIPESNLARHF